MVTKLKRAIVVEGEDDLGRLGLVHVYTGEGKGKTTASLGLAIRALGNGLRVYMIQFLKSGHTGELEIAKSIENFTIKQYGADALKEKMRQKTMADFIGNTKFVFEPDIAEMESCQMAFLHAREIIASGKYELVILDEINCAIDKGLIKVEDVLDILKTHGNTEIVLTGRDAPKEIMEQADYISVIQRLKHPWQKGIKARKGIEY